MNKKKYLFNKNNCVLNLDANTVGNSNSQWIDTSMFGGSGAIQSTTAYQPILTNDVFGVGNKGYAFDGSNDFMTIADSDNLSFCNDLYDLPFTLEVSFKFNMVTEAWIVNKRTSSTILEWQFIYYAGAFSIGLFDSTYSKYITARHLITPIAAVEYNIKITYDGSSIPSGLKMYKDNILLNTVNSGSPDPYVRMRNTSSAIYVGKFGQGGSFLNGAIKNIKITQGVN